MAFKSLMVLGNKKIDNARSKKIKKPTKNKGIAKLGILLVFAIMLTLSSCEELLFIQIRVQNNYFESLSNIAIEEVRIETLASEAKSNEYRIAKGEYPFTATTNSGLELHASLSLSAAQADSVLIVVNKKGRVELQ